MKNPWDNDPVVGGKTSSPAEFAQVYGSAAERAGKALGVDSKTLLGQWGLETGWGKSIIPGTNNLGNIKDMTGRGVMATDNMNGSKDKYRAYGSADEFADDYASLIKRKYPGAMGAGADVTKFTGALIKGGYAEDPRYADKMSAASRIAGKQGVVARGVDTVTNVFLPAANAASAATGNPWDNDPIVDASPAKAAPVATSAPKESSVLSSIGQGIGNVAAGSMRGAGSIGKTLLMPIDAAARAVGIQNDYIGRTDRGEAMDGGLQSMGAETDSLGYGAGKLGAEIAGTMGAGGMLAKGLGVIAPSATNLATALSTSGFKAGSATGLAKVAARMAGGAGAGAASAGLVDPSSAGTGATIGAALPGVLGVAGFGANKIGNLLSGAAVSKSVTDGVAAARQAGLVVPPTQAKPTLINRLMEGTAGKITTAQNASAKNAPVIDAMVGADLGIAKGTQITPEVLEGIRSKAGGAYKDVASLPVRPGQSANSLFNTPAIEKIDPKAMVYDLRVARNDADGYYKAYGRSADPEQLKKAQSAKALASSIESKLEKYAASVGRDDLIPALVEARKLIAKTYSVGSALNPATGTINAQKLAGMLNKGKPLSGGLKTAGEFAQRFPKAAQPLESMGSLPGVSPLDVYGAAATAGLTAVIPAVRMGARAAALSPFVQNRLMATAPNRIGQLMQSPEANQLLYRLAPQAANR